MRRILRAGLALATLLGATPQGGAMAAARNDASQGEAPMGGLMEGIRLSGCLVDHVVMTPRGAATPARRVVESVDLRVHGLAAARIERVGGTVVLLRLPLRAAGPARAAWADRFFDRYAAALARTASPQAPDALDRMRSEMQARLAAGKTHVFVWREKRGPMDPTRPATAPGPDSPVIGGLIDALLADPAGVRHMATYADGPPEAATLNSARWVLPQEAGFSLPDVAAAEALLARLRAHAARACPGALD